MKALLRGKSSRHFILGFLILDNSEKACRPQAISSATERAVNVVSVWGAEKNCMCQILYLDLLGPRINPNENWEAELTNKQGYKSKSYCGEILKESSLNVKGERWRTNKIQMIFILLQEQQVNASPHWSQLHSKPIARRLIASLYHWDMWRTVIGSA